VDAEYEEMDAAFGFIVGRKQTKQESDLALRAIRNLQGTPALAELESATERIQEKIQTTVEQTFADVRPKERRIDGFAMGEYM
jgi:hypothetical protein